MPEKCIKKKVLISVTNDLVTDRRVYKVSQSLIKFGFDVLLIGIKLKNSLPINYSFETKRMRMLFSKGPLFYAEFNIRLFFYLLLHKGDIYLANDLDSLPAAFRASKLRNKTLVYDSHEFFTELPELTGRKRTKSIWERIERKILPNVKYTYTVCDSIANTYNEKYGIQMRTIRNVPIFSDKQLFIKSEFLDQFKDKQIILYQGSLNMGRGLEQMITAMKYLNDAVFVIIGNGLIENDLHKLVDELNLKDKVHFVGKIPHEELPSFTNFADVGISMEENISLNYYYSLPNKLFDYIKANIPVLVSKFPETEKIVNTYNIGEFIENHEPEHIAEKIKYMINDQNKMSEYKLNLKEAAKDLCWENEEKKLKEIFIDL